MSNDYNGNTNENREANIDPREAFRQDEYGIEGFIPDMPDDCDFDALDTDFVSDDDFSSRFADDLDAICKEEINPDEEEWGYDDDDGMTDAEADADTFRSCGWGTDEDYGYFGDEY